MKFRKKPVVIEAYQWRTYDHDIMAEALQTPDVWPEWLWTARQKRKIGLAAGTAVAIETLEGAHKVSVGDWIIQGVKGELYPCKPDIFAHTYESAEGG